MVADAAVLDVHIASMRRRVCAFVLCQIHCFDSANQFVTRLHVLGDVVVRQHEHCVWRIQRNSSLNGLQQPYLRRSAYLRREDAVVASP